MKNFLRPQAGTALSLLNYIGVPFPSSVHVCSHSLLQPPPPPHPGPLQLLPTLSLAIFANFSCCQTHPAVVHSPIKFRQNIAWTMEHSIEGFLSFNLFKHVPQAHSKQDNSCVAAVSHQFNCVIGNTDLVVEKRSWRNKAENPPPLLPHAHTHRLSAVVQRDAVQDWKCRFKVYEASPCFRLLAQLWKQVTKNPVESLSFCSAVPV